ncbi:hypothetical protein KKF64_02675 [Patescibacteria group bacterium]|nr:hypothetical protein [Patescibacteria group bacterium]
MASVIIKLPNFRSGTLHLLDKLMNQGYYQELAENLGELLDLMIQLNKKKEVQLFQNSNEALEVCIWVYGQNAKCETIIWELWTVTRKEGTSQDIKILLRGGSIMPCDVQEALKKDPENPVRYILRKQDPVFSKSAEALFKEI